MIQNIFEPFEEVEPFYPTKNAKRRKDMEYLDLLIKKKMRKKVKNSIKMLFKLLII